MEKASIDMDLDEWELLPDNGFLNFGHESGKNLFSDVDMNYFIYPSQNSRLFIETTKEDSIPGSKHIKQVTSPIVEKNPDDVLVKDIKEISVVPPVIKVDRDVISQVFFKKLKENEFVDMKMDSPKSNSRGILPPIGFEEKDEDSEYTISKNSSLEEKDVEKEKIYSGSEIKGKACLEGISFSVWRWRLTGIGAICSIGVAAATICIFILGGRQRPKQQHQNQKLQFQIYADDKRIKQVVQQATRLNQTLLAVRGVPVTRAHISFGGYYDGL